MTLFHVQAGDRAERVDVPPIPCEDPPIRLERFRVLIQPLLAPRLALKGRAVVSIEPQRFHESYERGLVVAGRDARGRFPDPRSGRLGFSDGPSRSGPRPRRRWRLDGM